MLFQAFIISNTGQDRTDQPDGSRRVDFKPPIQNAAYAHRYRLRDEHGRTLLEHGGISLFELSKFAAGAVETE